MAVNRVTYISVFNTDDSKRHESIKTLDQLSKFLHENIESHFGKSDAEEAQVASTGSQQRSCLITLSEFKIRAAPKLQTLLRSFGIDNYEGYRFSPSDYSASFWSSNWRKVDEKHNACKDGKCLAVVLEDNSAGIKIVFLSVHLPRKTPAGMTDRPEVKTKTTKALLKLAENLRDNHQPDSIIIAGDFNMKPSEIKEMFKKSPDQAYTDIGIRFDTIQTIKDESSDNVLIKSTSAKKVVLDFVEVDKDDSLNFKHYPLFGECTVSQYSRTTPEEVRKIYISVIDAKQRNSHFNDNELCDLLIGKVMNYCNKSDENSDLNAPNQDGGIQDFDFGKSCLIVMNQINKTAAENLKELLTKNGRAYNFEERSWELKDGMVPFWSPNWHKAELAAEDCVSEDGKCVAVVLEDEYTGIKIIFISVHFRQMTAKRKGAGALLELAEKLRVMHQPDEILIAGYFNLRPSEIERVFQKGLHTPRMQHRDT